MNTSDLSAQQASLPALQTLIKPEQVQGIPSIPADQKDQYTQGIARIWEKLRASHPNTQEHYEAHKKLAEVSRNIKAQISKWRQENGTQGSRIVPPVPGRPITQGQQGQQGQPGVYGGQGNAPVPQGQTNEPFSEKILQTVRSMSLVIPPPMWSQPPENGQNWIREAKRKYAQYMQRFEISSLKLQEMSNTATQRQQQGKPLTEQEVHIYNVRKVQYQTQMQDAREHLNNFKKQQESFRAHQQAVNQGHGAQSNNGSGEPMPQTSQIGLSAPSSSQQQIRTEQSGQQQQPLNHALEAAKAQGNQDGQQAISSSTSGQGGTQQASQPLTTQSQGTTAGLPTSQVSQSSLSLNTSGPPSQQQQQHHSPQTTQPPMSTSQGPYPLSHKAAMEQVQRSYSQPNVSQSTPQSSAHAHPNIGGRDQQNTNAKMPIPKNLNVPPPQPVTMGPARPTLSGGASTGAIGPMGQPAIQKHPGYVLEGEGERVLSKKKLEELIRQVTGGGDREGGESLDPEVQEVLIIDLYSTKLILRCSCRHFSRSLTNSSITLSSPPVV